MIERQENTDAPVIGSRTAGFGAEVAAGCQGLNVALLKATSKVGSILPRHAQWRRLSSRSSHRRLYERV
jgi:succinate dehydrogenase/fumarate reductase flavoprotein subunit